MDEAHRRGLRVAAHTHGADAVRAAVEAGIDCIEHGFLIDKAAIELMVERGTFLVPTTFLADGMDVSKAAPELQAKAAEMFPRARTSVRAAYEAGVRIAAGTDAPAIPHGRNASELVALVSRGMSPLAVLRAATVTAAELIDVSDRGRLAEGLLADIIGVPGDPLQDITVTQDVRFVMKGAGTAAIELADDTATGTQPLCFVDHATHEMRIGYYNDTYVRTSSGWRLRTRAMTFIRRNGAHDSGRPHAYRQS